MTKADTRRRWIVLDLRWGGENHEPIMGVFDKQFMAWDVVNAEVENYRVAGGKRLFKTLDGWNLGKERQLRVLELPRTQ